MTKPRGRSGVADERLLQRAKEEAVKPSRRERGRGRESG
jgi:hypothetical protein